MAGGFSQPRGFGGRSSGLGSFLGGLLLPLRLGPFVFVAVILFGLHIATAFFGQREPHLNELWAMSEDAA